MKNYEDKIYSLSETVTGQTQAMSQAVQKTLENNGGVGIMTGFYDQNLSILSVSNLLLHSTGYTFDTFMKQTKGSLRNFFYDEEDILERDRFLGSSAKRAFRTNLNGEYTPGRTTTMKKNTTHNLTVAAMLSADRKSVV